MVDNFNFISKSPKSKYDYCDPIKFEITQNSCDDVQLNTPQIWVGCKVHKLIYVQGSTTETHR